MTSTTEPAVLSLFTEDVPEPDEAEDYLDLRALRGHIEYDADDGWPTLVFWDVEGTKIEFTAGICGFPAYRELAATGAEHLARTALDFAKAIRDYRLPATPPEPTNSPR